MIFGVEVGLAGVFGLEVGLPKAKERTCSRLLQKLVLRDPKATLETSGPALGGQFLDDFWSRIRWWKGVAKQIGGSLGGRGRAWC